MRIHFSILLVLALILASVGSAFAHDMFVMPDKFRVARGETLRIGFHSADGFPESTQLPKRLRDAVFHTTGGPVPIQLAEDGKRMAGNVMVPAAGYFIVTVTNAAAMEPMRPASFLSYIKEEGLTQIIQAREQRGEADKPARERYTMLGKSIVLAGTPNDDYKRVVGQPLEIVPERDPATLKAGESLPVRVLLKGAPAAGVQVMTASLASPKNQSIGKTDAQGRIAVPVKSGAWRLHTISMERAADTDADWETFSATLTFEMP